MSKRSKHIDQLYKEQLGDYSEMPPASVWESLALRLDEEDDKGGGFGDSGNDNGRPRFPIRWWWALLGLLLLIGTTVGIGKFVSFKTEQTTAVTTSPDANTRNKATAEVSTSATNDISTPAEQEAKSDAAPKGLPTNDNTTPPNNDNTNEQTNTTTKAKTKSKPATKTTTETEERTSAIEVVSKSSSQKVQHKVAAPTTAQKQADAKVAIAPTPKASAVTTTQTVTQQQAPLQEVEDKSTTKQTSNVIAQEQEKVVEEEHAEVKEVTKEASPQLTQEKEQEQQPKEELQKEEEKTDTKKEETTAKEEKQQVVEKEEEPQVVATAKEQAQEVAAPVKEETKTEETIKKEEEVVADQSENKQEETNTEENTASEEAIAAAKEQPQETKQEEETPQTQSLEVAEETTAEEEKTNELAYLSKNKKQLKKERKKKQKEEQETANEDNLGINEFNTLTPPPPKPRRWEIGIKAGYEYGFNTQAKADKFVLSPYLQYMVAPHFSLVFQPSYLWGNAKFTSAKPDEVYYNVVSTSFDSTLVIREGDTIDFKPDTLIATYIYGKVYDSTRVSYQLKQKQLWNIELPLILQYDISSRFSVYGGVSFNFSKVLSVQQNRLDYTGMTIMDTIVAKQTYAASLPPPLPAPPQDPASYFANYGSPISQYKPYTNNTQNSFTRVGFMLGFRYTFAERYMVDVLLQQSAVNKTVITDPELQKIYSQPYMRITLGYKIFK
ncbi:MAG: hypothetical protein R2800_14955 [Flavipsychrobacter sp.]